MVGKKFFGLAMLLVSLVFLASCGKKEETVTTSSDSMISDPVKPPDEEFPAPNPTDPPETPHPTPAPILKMVELKARALTSEEESKTLFPYSRQFFPVIGLEKFISHKDCVKNYEKKCVVDRQVGLAFDLAPFKTMIPEQLKVANAELLLDFYSVGKNHRTELFCSLDTRLCSGRGIIRHPQLGVPWLVKTLAWDSTFWKKGYDLTVLNELFHTTLEAGKLPSGLYHNKNAVWKLQDLLNWRMDNFKEYLLNKDVIKFSVTDDTFIENARLRVYLEVPKNANAEDEEEEEVLGLD